MKIYWKIEIENYKKTLRLLEYQGKKFENIEYLTEMIPFIIEELEFIYVGFDSEKNNVWNTYLTWSHPASEPFNIEEDDNIIYGGIYNISKIRKQKLKKLSEY